MAILDFPASPTVGQQYAAPNGVTYQWDGAAWVVTGGPPGQLWTGAGATLTPTDATKTVAVPGPTASGSGVDQSAFLFGSRTMKGRVHSLPTLDWVGYSATQRYNGTTWAQDDATRPGWAANFDPVGDVMNVARYPPGSGTATIEFQVKGSDGKTYCTLADQSVTAGMLGVQATTRQPTVGTVGMPVGTLAGTTEAVIATVPALTYRGGVVLLLFDISMRTYLPDDGTLVLRLYQDSTLISARNMRGGVATPICACGAAVLALVVPAAGSHSFTARWVRALGTGNWELVAAGISAVEFG